MNESELAFHIFYVLITYCLFYPPIEFETAGLTTDSLLTNFYGSPILQFVQYNIRRCCVTLLIHSTVPLIYVILYYFQFFDPSYSNIATFCWEILFVFSVALPILSAFIIWYWSQNNWENHPICKNLKKYCNNNLEWSSVAGDVNTEYRRDNKMEIRTNAIFKVIATENWVMKTTPYTVYFAHQSDTALIVDKSDTHNMSVDAVDSIQFVNIQVKPTRTGTKSFSIRINALDFKDLQDRISRPITILSSVQFHQTVMDRFIEVFKEQIAHNPKYVIEQQNISESCFACMAAEPNIKIQKQCLDVRGDGEMIPDSEKCVNCYCGVMWCAECLAKWFASRQNQFEKEVWLQQKCSCPMCRAKFCVHDVCLVEKI